MSAAFDIKEWLSISVITAIESKNQVVVSGRRTLSDPSSLYTYQRNLDGTVEETRMDAPCQHYALLEYYKLVTAVQNGKELIAMLCDECRDIKLVDMETKQVTPVYQFPPDSRDFMYSGPNGGLFVTYSTGTIQQLDSSFGVINTFNEGEWSPIGTENVRGVNYNVLPASLLCYLPAPHNTLVVHKVSELRAVSLQGGHQVWSQQCEGFLPYCLLFCPQQDVLLVSAWFKPEVHVLNPSDGSILQTIEIPNIYWFGAMCLCNDQIVMTQWAEEDTLRALLSYYSLKQHF